MLGAQFHANPMQGRDPVWHQPFRANFVDQRTRSIRDHNVKSALAGGKRSSESGWTAPNYEDIGFRGHGAQVHQCTKIISWQTPGPFANGKPYMPSADT